MKLSTWYHKSNWARGWEKSMILSRVEIECATIEMAEESSPFGAQRRATSHVTFRKAKT